MGNPSDDVNALFSHVGLDSSKYREFSSARRPKGVEQGPTPDLPAETTVNPVAAVEVSATEDKNHSIPDEPIAPEPVRGDGHQGKNAHSQAAPHAPPLGFPGHSRRRRAARVRATLTSQTTSQASRAPVDQVFPEIPHEGQGSSRLQKKPIGGSCTPEATPHAEMVVAPAWEAARNLAFRPATPSAITQELPRGSFAFFSLGGGTGKTTVCASVAHYLRAMGESLLIADFADESMFPLYFGSNRIRSGSLETFLGDDQQDIKPLHLYRAADTAMGWTNADSMVRHLGAQVSALGDNFDRVILDIPAGAHNARWPLFQAARMCLVVIVPDLHSVLGSGKLEEIRSQQQQDSESEVSFYYVLNKFNPARSFHLEIQRRLHQQLGDRLLPIYIQRSDDIAEALVAGGTVFDYAPEAPVVEDFVRLAEWIRTIA